MNRLIVEFHIEYSDTPCAQQGELPKLNSIFYYPPFHPCLSRKHLGQGFQGRVPINEFNMFSLCL